MTIISTHHTSLKVYAANTPGVLNAAAGFDETTLQPTYELRMGVPGASAGINIAQRLGLNPEIVAAARSRLGAQALDIANFLVRFPSAQGKAFLFGMGSSNASIKKICDIQRLRSQPRSRRGNDFRIQSEPLRDVDSSGGSGYAHA